MSPVALHDVSACPASASEDRSSHPSSVAPRRFLARFVRSLLRVVVGASVPIDGARWKEGNTRGEISAVSADRTTQRRKAEVASERLPVRWANWR
jgi:hypothetical protein